MRYRALYIVSRVLRVVSYIGAAAALVGSIVGAFAAGGGLAAVGGLVGGVIAAAVAWLLITAYAEAIDLMLASEGFLREAAEHLRALAGRSGPGGMGPR